MIVGHENGVVGLTEFSDRGFSSSLKSGRNKGMVVLTGRSYGGVQL